MNNEQSRLVGELRAGRAVASQTFGDSMQPLLYQGETTVLVVPVTGRLKRNDLPLYRRPTGQLVMHRIIRVEKDGYRTRGDNRTGLESVPEAWVIGVVSEITRRGRVIPVTARGYRAYVHAWNLIYPLRWGSCKLRAVVRGMKKRRSHHVE